MKRILKYTAFLSAFFLSVVSCDLKENTISIISPDDYYATESQCRAALNSCYIPLKSIYTFEFELCVEGCTDLLSAASGVQDAQLDISPANPRFGTTVWKQCYTGIRNANACIYGIDASDIAPAAKASMVAEAKAMRAFYYYLLTSFFGDVPFYTYQVSDIPTLKKVQKLPRMDADSTRAYLVKELQECVGDLTWGRAYDVANQRAGSAFAYTLIAKMAMWNKDWSAAADALEQIISMYGSLDAYPLADVPYRFKNTPESIFEIQHTWSADGIKAYSNLACISMPYQRAEGTDKYDGVSIPELGSEAITYVPMRPNYYMCQGLMPKGGVDKRLDMTFVYGWNGQDFASTEARPFMGPKLWCYGMTKTYDSNNYTIFRYADCLLMYAECCAELGLNSESMAALNEVKNRAGIDPYVRFRTKARLIEEIQKERARELVGEFQRKFDLVRWEIWYQQTYEFTDYSTLKNNIRPYHEYYPIPDNEVALSGGALDNKAYEQSDEN